MKHFRKYLNPTINEYTRQLNEKLEQNMTNIDDLDTIKAKDQFIYV